MPLVGLNAGVVKYGDVTVQLLIVVGPLTAKVFLNAENPSVNTGPAGPGFHIPQR